MNPQKAFLQPYGKFMPWLLGLFILTTYLYPLFLFPIHNPNERVRIYMTAAMVEEGTFAIGYRQKRSKTSKSTRDVGTIYKRWGYVNDKALVCNSEGEKPPKCEGTLYSAKAPGSSFLGYPFYAALHFAGEVFEAPVKKMDGIILYLRFFVVILPTLLMLFFVRRFALQRGLAPIQADLITAAVAVGSMVYTYTHMFAGHQISAWLLFFSFYTAYCSGDKRSPIWPIATGLLGAMGVCVEYPMVVVFLPVFLYQWRRRPGLSTWIWFGVGALGPTLLAAWYHWAAFGHPLRTAYSTLENPQFVKDIAHGFMGLRAPKVENLFGAFFAPYEGLFYFAPWMLAAFVAPVIYYAASFRRDDRSSRQIVFCGVLAMVLLSLFILCHSLWRGGWTLGPRYIVAIVPFGAIALTQAWASRDRLSKTGRSWSLTFLVLTVVSIAITGASSMVSQGFHTAFFNPVAEAVWPLLSSGYVTLNLGHLMGLDGLFSLVPLMLLSLPFVLFAIWYTTWRSTHSWQRNIFTVLLVLFMISAGLKGSMLPHKAQKPSKIKALAYTRANFFPDRLHCQDARDRRFRRAAARDFPQHAGINANRLYDLATAGKCKDTLYGFKKYSDAERIGISDARFHAVLISAMPFPILVPIPLSVRRDYRISHSAFMKLQRAD